MTFDDDELAFMMRVTLTFDISSLTLEKYVYADDTWIYNYVKQLYYIMISLSVCVNSLNYTYNQCASPQT